MISEIPIAVLPKTAKKTNNRIIFLNHPSQKLHRVSDSHASPLQPLEELTEEGFLDHLGYLLVEIQGLYWSNLTRADNCFGIASACDCLSR